MNKNIEIKKMMVRGDIPIIAERAGLSKVYVKKVLNGERNSDHVVQIAEEWIQIRRSFQKNS